METNIKSNSWKSTTEKMDNFLTNLQSTNEKSSCKYFRVNN